MYKYQNVLEAFINKNSANIWRLVTLRNAVANVDKHIGNQMAKWGPPTIHDDQAHVLFKLLQRVTSAKQKCSTGARLPDFMNELVRCIRSEAGISCMDASVKSEQLVAVSPQQGKADSLAIRSPPTTKKGCNTISADSLAIRSPRSKVFDPSVDEIQY
jgi:hypothetical protein